MMTAVNWVGSHARWLALGIGVMFGIALGAWFGSAADCTQKGCDVSVEIIGVVGTWVGGFGTILALFFAARTLRHDQEMRAEERQASEDEKAERAVELAREEQRLQYEANMIRCTRGS